MEGQKYNMCHFWSNFEIARLDWFRSKEYNEFFEMMDRSGGFWNERVSASSTPTSGSLTDNISGVMHPFTLSPLELFSRHATSTISGTLVTGIRPSNTVLQTHQLVNCPGYHGLRKRQKTTRNDWKKTNTGQHQTSRKRTGWDAGAGVTLTFEMLKAKRVAVSLNGWKLLGAGHRPEPVRQT